MMLAQTTVSIPLSSTMETFVGLIGLITVAVMILWFITLLKQVFAKQPSTDQQIEDQGKSLRSEIHHAKNSALKEMAQRQAAIEARTAVLERRHDEMQLDRERKWKELQGEMSELRETLAFIRGKFEHKDQK